MGGVKNNLTKKLSKFLPLDREGGRRSLLDGVINNKVPLWLKGNVRRQSDKGIVLTKYLGIACLTLAILSTLILNIISSYSSNKVNSNAEPISNSNANLSTLANTTLDPTSISISISSHSATGDANDGNLSLSIPQGGGLVAGRHTVSVNAGSEIDSYIAYLNSAVDNKALVNDEDSSRAINASSDGTSYEMPGFGIRNNTWGVALPDRFVGYVDADKYESLITNPVKSNVSSDYADSNYPIAGIASPNNLDYSYSIGEVKHVDGSGTTALPSVYYVVRVDNPSTMLAGDYTTDVIYTVVAELKAPSIDSVSPNPIRTGTTNKITLRGNNLDIVSKATIDDRGTIRDCTSITHSGTNNDTTLTCTLPAISNTGTYVITAETEGGQTTTAQIQLIPPAPTISSVSPNEINTNDSAAILTIVGTNLATTSSIYIDFNNNNTADSGEACTIKTKDNGQVTCTAPSRSSTGGPYTVRLTTDGGSASKAGAVSYVESLSVAWVSPSGICALTMKGYTATFTISGTALDDVTDITIFGSSRFAPMVESNCNITSKTGDQIICRTTWQYGSQYVTEPQMTMELYSGTERLYTIDDFVAVNPC